MFRSGCRDCLESITVKLKINTSYAICMPLRYIQLLLRKSCIEYDPTT